MSIIVMKFGGTSVADIDCIKNVAQKVVNQYKKNKKIVVVVSAMSGATDNLVNLTNQISEKRNLEEYDVVVSSGEQVTAGLLAMAITDLSVKSRSLMGWQIPIKTDGTHYKAIIENISNTKIFTLLNNLSKLTDGNVSRKY